MTVIALITHIEQLMRERDWNQQDLSAATNIPDATLSRLLTGKIQEPKPSMLLQLATGVGVSFRELMLLAGYPVDDDSINTLTSQRINALNTAFPWFGPMAEEIADLLPEDREAVLAYLEVIRQRRARSDAIKAKDG